MKRATVVFGAVVLCAVATANAQVSYSVINSAYSQNFDTLATSGTPTWTNNATLVGWYALQSLPGGTSSIGFRDPSSASWNPVSTYRGSDGSSNAGALYSFGSTTTGPLTDRALGSI